MSRRLLWMLVMSMTGEYLIFEPHVEGLVGFDCELYSYYSGHQLNQLKNSDESKRFLQFSPCSLNSKTG